MKILAKKVVTIIETQNEKPEVVATMIKIETDNFPETMPDYYKFIKNSERQLNRKLLKMDCTENVNFYFQ